MSKHQKKIYFLVPYPSHEAPSQRFRFEQYYHVLDNEEIEYRVSSFLDLNGWQILYKPGKEVLKAIQVLLGLARRVADLFRLVSYDYVFIHREAAPIGPPILEWIIAKLLRKKIIYDFDDAIWIANISANNKIAAGLKWHSKVASICRWSYKVSCGNDYLADYARKYNQHVVINPTTIDTLSLHNRVKAQDTKPIVIGWTGTHSTAQYLDIILPVLKKLEYTYDFVFNVISNAPIQYDLKSMNYIDWNKDSEIDDLLQFNIGVMPLSDDQWAKGKCGFKALQYMSLGIPALVSPVGVNTEIVDNQKSGMVCSTAQEWEQAIISCINNTEMRIAMGKEARKKIEDNYSVLSNTPNFLFLFS